MEKIIPIQKIFSIINSCLNFKQLQSCENIALNYTNLLKNKGLINYMDVLKILKIKIEEKRSELNLSNNFKGKIRRKKAKEVIFYENFY